MYNSGRYIEMQKVYSKTTKLGQAKFKGQKALVVDALSSCSTPVTIDVLAPIVDKHGRYSALLNEWAKENGGVKASIQHHLRALKNLGKQPGPSSSASHVGSAENQ
jgi:hypothetical protein